MDDLRTVGKFLKKNEKDSEHPVESQARQRVRDSLAQGIRTNKPLPTERCRSCGKNDMVSPIVLFVCEKCYDKLGRSGEPLKIITQKRLYSQCQWCFKQKHLTLQVNPKICYTCIKKYGWKTREFEQTKNKKTSKAKKKKENITNRR